MMVRGWWKLRITNIEADVEIELTDETKANIARLIQDDFTEGEIIQED